MSHIDATILLVDDETDLLETMACALRTEGYRIFSAASGHDALALLEETEVDLILADVAMPQMNGYQLYERVRSRQEWIAIPFIMLTGRIMDSDIRYARTMGVDDYLTKPVELDDLLATVHGRLVRTQQLAQIQSSEDSDASPEDGPVTIGSLRLDPSSHQAWYDRTPLTLSAREFILLKKFMQSPGKVLDVATLVNSTHDLTTDSHEAGSLLRPLIRSLRKKLAKANRQESLIENVRGVGYRLVTDQ